MVEIANRQQLEAWLKEQGRDVAMAIATRAALRALRSLAVHRAPLMTPPWSRSNSCMGGKAAARLRRSGSPA